jgi:hypothetical protein
MQAIGAGAVGRERGIREESGCDLMDTSNGVGRVRVDTCRVEGWCGISSRLKPRLGYLSPMATCHDSHFT